MIVRVNQLELVDGLLTQLLRERQIGLLFNIRSASALLRAHGHNRDRSELRPHVVGNLLR